MDAIWSVKLIMDEEIDARRELDRGLTEGKTQPKVKAEEGLRVGGIKWTEGKPQMRASPCTTLSCHCWASPVVYSGPYPAGGPSSGHRSPCAWGTGWHSSPGPWTDPGWSGTWGCSEATGSCRSSARDSLWVGICCFCWCLVDCGPSSAALVVKTCLWLERRSSSYSKHKNAELLGECAFQFKIIKGNIIWFNEFTIIVQERNPVLIWIFSKYIAILSWFISEFNQLRINYKQPYSACTQFLTNTTWT